jgi:hypothetical protein
MRWFGWNLDDETFASLGAASVEDGAPGRRAHPGKETVRAFSANIAWLICPFHCDSSV